MNYERVLVFAAHPDDELAISGTIAKLSDLGVRVIVVQMTDGCEGYSTPDLKGSIVRLRREEAEAANAVLGIARRIHIGRPDMDLVNTKETLKSCIKAIREEQPDAIFTHGPDDPHRDHVNTHAISVEARFHAGEPVAAELGESWSTPHLFFIRGVRSPLPRIDYDVTGYAHKRYEALATQTTQHVLFEQHWGLDSDGLLREARAIKDRCAAASETLWIAEGTVFNDLPPRGL